MTTPDTSGLPAGKPLALVTGASSGIGLELAKQFAQHGFDLVVAAENPEITQAASELQLAKRIIPEMVDRGRGKVLITSSIASTQPGPYEAVYAATKAFDQSFAESIRTELEDTGVTVTALMPGVTRTNFFRRADMTDTRAGGDEKVQDDPAKVAEQGFQALMDGEEKVVAGNPLNKVMAAAGRITPDAVKGKMHTALSEPGSNE
jgi:uncharacterized protein